MRQQVINNLHTLLNNLHPTKPVLQILKYWWEKRNYNNCKDQQLEVLLHKRELPEKIATIAEKANP